MQTLIAQPYPVSDDALVEAVARRRDPEALAAVVDRYLRLVYGVSCRNAGADLAEDVSQAVFLLFWENASRVRRGKHLAGWLVNAARLTAMQAWRGEHRRRRRTAPEFPLRLMGVEGQLPADGKGLVMVTNKSDIKTAWPYVFYPVYLSHLGRGRIVGCQFGPWWPAPPAFATGGRREFFKRCVQWLTERTERP